MGCDREAKSMLKMCRCPCRWRCKCPLIPIKKKPHPPFNSGVDIGMRDTGMHPLLKMTSSDSPAPGTYDPNSIGKAITPVTSWKREEASKEFSTIAGIGGNKIIEKYGLSQREIMLHGRGPGTHEIPRWPETTVLNFSSLLPNARQKSIGFGVTTPRFGKSSFLKPSETPGPGYNGKNHNPYYYLDENKFKSFNSKFGSFEFDGLVSRFRRPSRSWSIPCNRYSRAKHPDCLEKILNKVTGKRGPYDLFSGPRDSITLSGYQALPKSVDTKNWPIKFPTSFDRAFAGSNGYKGVFTKCPRFTKKPTVRMMLEDISLCYKDPDSPGPGFYSPNSSPSDNRSIARGVTHPFNDSVKNVRPLSPWEIRPAPGSYEINYSKYKIQGDGWTSVFKSKVQRRIGPKPDQFNSF